MDHEGDKSCVFASAQVTVTVINGCPTRTNLHARRTGSSLEVIVAFRSLMSGGCSLPFDPVPPITARSNEAGHSIHAINGEYHLSLLCMLDARVLCNINPIGRLLSTEYRLR